MESIEFEDNINDEKDLELALLEIINNNRNHDNQNKRNQDDQNKNNSNAIDKIYTTNRRHKCRPCIKIVEWSVFHLMLLGAILSLTTIVMMPFGAQVFYYSKHLVETNYTITRYETMKLYCPGYNIPDNVIIGYDNDSDYYHNYNNNYNTNGDDDGRYFAVPWTTLIYGQWTVPGENPSSSGNYKYYEKAMIITCGAYEGRSITRAQNYYPLGKVMKMWTWDTEHTFVIFDSKESLISVFWFCISVWVFFASSVLAYFIGYNCFWPHIYR